MAGNPDRSDSSSLHWALDLCLAAVLFPMALVFLALVLIALPLDLLLAKIIRPFKERNDRRRQRAVLDEAPLPPPDGWRDLLSREALLSLAPARAGGTLELALQDVVTATDVIEKTSVALFPEFLAQGVQIVGADPTARASLLLRLLHASAADEETATVLLTATEFDPPHGYDIAVRRREGDEPEARFLARAIESMWKMDASRITFFVDESTRLSDDVLRGLRQYGEVVWTREYTKYESGSIIALAPLPFSARACISDLSGSTLVRFMTETRGDGCREPFPALIFPRLSKLLRPSPFSYGVQTQPVLNHSDLAEMKPNSVVVLLPGLDTFYGKLADIQR